jgi:hypothetical protein
MTFDGGPDGGRESVIDDVDGVTFFPAAPDLDGQRSAPDFDPLRTTADNLDVAPSASDPRGFVVKVNKHFINPL